MRSLTKHLTSVAVVSGLSALAPLNTAAADQLMQSVTSDQLASILKTAGATEVEVKKSKSGIEGVMFNDGKGPVIIMLSDCNAGSCQSLQMTVVFSKDDSGSISLSTLNAFNAKYLNAQAAFAPSGDLVLADLLVTNGGITEQNLKANLAVFLQAPQLFIDHVGSQKTTALDKPGNVPAAAPSAAPGIAVGLGTQTPRVGNLDLLELLAADTKPRTRHLP